MADAINYKLIHYQAALRVLEDLRNKVQGPLVEKIGRLSVLIEQAGNALNTDEAQNPLIDSKLLERQLGGKRKKGLLTRIFSMFSREQTALIRAGSNDESLPGSIRQLHIRTALASMIHGKLRSLGLKGGHLSIEAIDRQIFNRYIDILQQGEWHNIWKTQTLHFADGTGRLRRLEFQTEMTPARNMDSAFSQRYEEDGVNGICSYATRERRHAVNLWRTEFRPLQAQEPNSGFEFSGLRHGVHDAYGIEDPHERMLANDARVNEFIHASVLEHLGRNRLDPGQLDRQKVLEIDVVSVNLLTPVTREKQMLFQQQDALQRANGKTVDVQVGDSEGNIITLKVKPRILAFNTPVNMLALSSAGKLLRIWRTADAINNRALKALLGSIEQPDTAGGMAAQRIRQLETELANLPADSPQHEARRTDISRKIALIKQLCEQIKNIYLQKSHHRVQNEPYKLPVRLLALANEIGATPAFNCKSGKDRTGQLNVEIRDLYAYLNAENGNLRAVNLKREGLAQENYLQLFVGGGDREIQTMNTGAPGSKSQLPYYNKLMGVTPKTIDEIRGLSKWVGT